MDNWSKPFVPVAKQTVMMENMWWKQLITAGWAEEKELVASGVVVILVCVFQYLLQGHTTVGPDELHVGLSSQVFYHAPSSTIG